MTLLAHGAPAGGAPLEDVVIATAVGAVAAAIVVAFGWAHRSGRISLLDRVGVAAERVSGMPRWAAVPGVVTAVSLIVAVFGFYWDVSTHIDIGRDPGPFANPAHFWILAGLGGIALAGALAVIYGCDGEQCPPTAVSLRDNWQVPVGAVLLLLCGVVALAGFPLDDVWHRLFGQDVTLWGPTHIQMVGGASLATLAQWVLFVEGQRAPAARGHDGSASVWLMRFRDVGLGGAFLIAMSTLQGEFDFGVPQFRLLYHPVLIMFAAGSALVAARVRLGRGGALGSAAFYLVIRGALTAIIGPGLGRIVLHFPLYIAEAAVVELVAARVGRDRQLTLGAWSGVAIGTVGLAAEWAWSHVWMPLPWPASLAPEALVLGPLAAVAGGLVGGLIGRAIAPPSVARQASPRWLPGLVTLGAVAVLFWPLPMTAPDGVVAELDVDEVAAGSERTVDVTVRIDPPAIAEGAEWLTVTAWQGTGWTDEQSRIEHLERTGPGTYTTTEPIPVHGNWKAMVRLHAGRAILAAPVFLPADEAISAEEVPAVDATREFVADREVLQREARDAASWMWTVGYTVLALIVALWIAAMTWGLVRLDRRRPRVPAGPVERPRDRIPV